jgi:hypothetical protein
MPQRSGVEWQTQTRRIGVSAGWLVLMAAAV